MSNEFKIVCGSCKADVQIFSEPHGEAVVCSKCDQRDHLEDAQRIAGEHFLHEMIPDIQKSIGNALKGNGPLKFTPKRQLSRAYRWHAVPLDNEDESD